jgi:hypothetical protein
MDCILRSLRFLLFHAFVFPFLLFLLNLLVDSSRLLALSDLVPNAPRGNAPGAATPRRGSRRMAAERPREHSHAERGNEDDEGKAPDNKRGHISFANFDFFVTFVSFVVQIPLFSHHALANPGGVGRGVTFFGR